MAALTEQQVRHVAKLARLNLTDAEITTFTQQLGEVLRYVEKLSELDTSNVEPTAHAVPLRNVLRPDKPRPGMGVDKVLGNAPDAEPPFFRVPKVLDQGDSGV